MTKKIELHLPLLPNFLRIVGYENTSGTQATSFTIPVADLTEDEMFEYAEYLKQGFITHYYNRVKLKNNVKAK